MSSLLDYTKNTRAILPGSYSFIRSDLPARLSERDMEFLRENRIMTAVDLRTPEEIAKKPGAPAGLAFMKYLNLPVKGGGRVPGSPEEVVDSYIEMLDGIGGILDTIEHAGNVIYFCSAGKDRTGVVSALLLRRLGFDDEYIIADYLKSGENLRAELELYAKTGIDLNVITPRRENIEGLLRYVRERMQP